MEKKELQIIATQIKKDKQPYKLTKRTLINAFGFEKRTAGNVAIINNWLDQYDLMSSPDYRYGNIDEEISLCYKYHIKSDNFQLYLLKIKEYKNLLNLAIDFENTDNYCCLIGLNGSGKSNVLEAISLIFYSLYHIATLKDGLKKYPCKFQYTIRYILNGNLYEISNGILKGGDKISMDILPKNIIASYSGEDTRLWKECYKPIYEKYCSKMVATPGFRPPFMFYVGRYEWEISLLTLLYSEDVDVIKFINDLTDNSQCRISFEYDNTNIRKWEGTEIEGFIEKLKENNEYSIESFRNIINEINFIDQASTLFYCLYKCRTEGDNQVIKKINILFSNKGTMDGLSEGEKKLINSNLIIHILSNKDSLCLFDEPDSHIHTARKTDLGKLFNIGNRYSIITTHSSIFLNQLQNKNIISLKRGKIENLDTLAKIKELSGGLINYFDGTFFLDSSNPLILVEGIGDINYINKAIEVLKPTKPQYNQISWDILCMGGAGENAKQYVDKLRPLINNNRNVVVVLDRDDSGAEAMKKFGITGGRENFKTYKDNNWYFLMLPKTDEHTDIDFTIEDYFSIAYKKQIAQKKIEDSGGFFKKFPKDLRQNVKDTLGKNINNYTALEMLGFSILIDKIINILSGADPAIEEIIH